MAAGLILAYQRELGLGRGLGEEIVHARLARDSCGRQRIVSRDHHGADAHGAQMIKALANAAFHDVGQLNRAHHAEILRYQQRRAT